MEREQIILNLQSIIESELIILTQQQYDAIIEACAIIQKASTREQWLLAIQKLGPLLIELGSKVLGP
jgi:hypothetical protein